MPRRPRNYARQRLVRIPHRFLKAHYLDGEVLNYKVTKGLPADAAVVRVIDDPVFGELKVVFASAAWPELKPGDTIPEQQIELFKLSGS